MGTHSRVLRESYLMNTNMIGYRCFSKTLCRHESSLSIGKVKSLISPLRAAAVVMNNVQNL